MFSENSWRVQPPCLNFDPRRKSQCICDVKRRRIGNGNMAPISGEVICPVCNSKPIGRKGCARNCSLIAISTSIVGIPVEWVIRHQSVGEKGLSLDLSQ